MARKCKVCSHPKLNEINQSLIKSRNISELSRKYEIPWDSLKRHKELHLPALLQKAQEAEEVSQADTLLAQVEELKAKAWKLLNKAERAGDLRTALSGVREAKGCLELLAKLQGELQQEGTVNVSLFIPQIVGIISQEIRDAQTLERISHRLLEFKR